MIKQEKNNPKSLRFFSIYILYVLYLRVLPIYLEISGRLFLIWKYDIFIFVISFKIEYW